MNNAQRIRQSWMILEESVLLQVRKFEIRCKEKNGR